MWMCASTTTQRTPPRRGRAARELRVASPAPRRAAPREDATPLCCLHLKPPVFPRHTPRHVRSHCDRVKTAPHTPPATRRRSHFNNQTFRKLILPTARWCRSQGRTAGSAPPSSTLSDGAGAPGHARSATPRGPRAEAKTHKNCLPAADLPPGRGIGPTAATFLAENGTWRVLTRARLFRRRRGASRLTALSPGYVGATSLQWLLRGCWGRAEACARRSAVASCSSLPHKRAGIGALQPRRASRAPPVGIRGPFWACCVSESTRAHSVGQRTCHVDGG